MEIPITLPISKKTISITKYLSRKQVVSLRQKAGLLMAAIQAPQDFAGQQAVMNRSAEQDELVADILLNNTNCNQETLDNMPYPDALFAFTEVFKVSTEIPKN